MVSSIPDPMGGLPIRPHGAPAEPSGNLQVTYNPQDDTVMPSETVTIGKAGPGLQSPAVVVEGDPVPAQDGKYVFDRSDARYVDANTFAAVSRTHDMWEKALGHPIQWSFGSPQLGIKPDDGEDLNAYYTRDGGDLHFFHATDPVTKQVVYSGDSGEVVSHETGHAVLDSVRPNYFSSFSPDPAAFHESFGDVSGMLTALQDDRVIDRVLQQTGGDLSRDNILADTGEELGKAINDTTGKNTTGGDYVRTALNNFKWQDPSTLPDRGGPDQLGSEAHSFSRLWTGAVYDLLKGLNDENLAAGMSPHDALKTAGQDLLQIYANLFNTTAPQGDFTYRDMAKAMVASDVQADKGKHADLITKVFTNRGILQPGDGGAAAQQAESHPVIFSSTTNPQDLVRKVTVHLNGPQFGTFNGAVVETPVDKDGALAQDSVVQTRTQSSLAKLIQSGRIKYAEPGQTLTQKDLFDREGRPYVGVVKWIDGQMKIERVKIAD